MKRFLALSLATFGLAAFAAVAPGENLLQNGRFETDQTALPLGWVAMPLTDVLEHRPTGGPNGLPSMRWSNASGKPTGELTYRQGGLKLVPNGRYRISCQVRTESFGGHADFVVINTGWTAAAGIERIPEGTREWTRIEHEFTCGTSSDGFYAVAVSIGRLVGTIEFADVRLEALDESARTGSEKPNGGRKWRAPRLIPWQPLLCRIPESDRAVNFKFFGSLPDGTVADYDVSVVPEGAPEVRQPLVPALNKIFLPTAAREGMLRVGIVARAAGTNVFEQMFAYRVIRPVEANADEHVRLNTLVTRVLRKPLEKTAEEQDFRFWLPRDGWVFLQVRTLRPESGLKVLVDGVEVLDARFPRSETFRRLAAGGHAVSVRGCASGGGIRIHAIPEIFNYCVNNSVVRENPPFDWAFQERHVLPAVTTLNGSDIPKDERGWFAERGYEWVGNISGGKLKDDDDLRRRIEATPFMRDGLYSGASIDEVNLADDKAADSMTRGLRRYDQAAVRDLSHSLYVWFYGKPMNEVLAADFMSVCANASGGRGRMLFEAYAATKETEEDAIASFLGGFRDAIVRFRAVYPLSVPSTGLIFGNFMQYPVISLVHHPGVDFKRHLDLQLHLLATDSAFEGLGAVGYWGSYYIDEEHLRWSFALMRHYFVEGKTDLLSDRFGYVYNPHFIRNPDFEFGTEDWTTEGNVTMSAHKGFGRLSGGRWSSGATPGDTFAVMTRGDKPNMLSQKVSGLVPGRLYRLEAIVADADDVEATRVDGRRFPVEIVLTGVERDESRSWVHVETKCRYNKQPSARVNLHHQVFRATGSETILRITDEAASKGMRHAVNCVSVCPYFE